MRNRRKPGIRSRANRAVDDFASRIDGQTADAARRAAQVLTVAVRLLRWPSLALLVVPLPFIAAVALIAAIEDSNVRWFALVAAVAMAVVSITFGLRRWRILQAVEDPDKLATELGIAVSMSGKVDDARSALLQITSGSGSGPRMFTRLRGVWTTVGLSGRWIDSVGDLPRARYFFPPRVGTTVAITLAAAWLVPISFVAFLLLGIAALAN
ncbi:hypothetical protein [uncultured Aeromicrobium sp.]|uniref:hypothetical protein n=1 Tax=uncultured Aeromicrobium sp. TaxID=337820 RepID=UPI002601040F|nr:hypothetical protein [uncultured Aeromicrobium sp.]